MSELVYLASADADLLEIFSTIAQDDPRTAQRFIDRIRKSVLRLADFPLSAQARPEFGEGIRSIPVGSYRVLHRVEPDRVLIVRRPQRARLRWPF